MYTKALKEFSRKLETIYAPVLAVSSQAKLLGSSRIKLKFLGRINKRFLFVLIGLLCVLTSIGFIAASQRGPVAIASYGNVKVDGVGVYSDANCSTVVVNIDWGTLEPGSSKNITLYVRNEGNHVATISLAASSWNPVNASNYMTLGWTYDGRILGPEETVEVVLTLHVSSNVENIAGFSFDVIIGAMGTP